MEVVKALRALCTSTNSNTHHTAFNPLVQILLAPTNRLQRSPNRPGSNRIHSDFPLRKLYGQGTSEPDDGALGRAVVDQCGGAFEGGDGGGVDDRGAFVQVGLWKEMWVGDDQVVRRKVGFRSVGARPAIQTHHSMFSQVNHRHNVDLERTLHILLLEILNLFHDLLLTRIVHKNVQPTELADGFINHSLAFFFAFDQVAWDQVALTGSAGGDHLGGVFGVFLFFGKVCDCNIGAFESVKEVDGTTYSRVSA